MEPDLVGAGLLLTRLETASSDQLDVISRLLYTLNLFPTSVGTEVTAYASLGWFPQDVAVVAERIDVLRTSMLRLTWSDDRLTSMVAHASSCLVWLVLAGPLLYDRQFRRTTGLTAVDLDMFQLSLEAFDAILDAQWLGDPERLGLFFESVTNLGPRAASALVVNID